MNSQKKYRTIYADPPWELKAGRQLGKYKVEGDKQIWISSESKSRDLAYPTMGIEEIKALPVQSVADENCHLYLWTTNKHLPYAF